MRQSLRDIHYAILFTVCLVIGCSMGGGTSAAAPAGEEAAINALLDQFEASYAAKNYDNLEKFFHSKANAASDLLGSHKLMYAGAWVDALEASLADTPMVMEKMTNRDITLYRNIATLVTDVERRKGLDHTTFKRALTVIKLGGSWQIFSLVEGAGESSQAMQEADVAAIDAHIDEFQESYSAKAYQRLRDTFYPQGNVAIDYSGSTSRHSHYISAWIAITEELLSSKGTVSDVLSDRQIAVYGDFALMVADYNYITGNDHQAGQDIMTLVKVDGKWKILCLTFYGDSV